MEASKSLITKVEKQKGNKHRYNIFLDGDYAFSVHEDIMIRHRIIKDEFIDKEELELILAADERHQTYLEAIRYVGRRPRSQLEVRQHLKEKGYDAERIDEAVTRLVKERYLDDRSFAKLWTEHRIVSQRKGRRWVEQELSQKGVDDSDIITALQSIDPEEEEKAAYELGLKKWRITSGEGWERRRKVMAFLLRRGYPNGLVQQTLRQIMEEHPSLENMEDVDEGLGGDYD